MSSLRLETEIAARVGECFDLSVSVDAHTSSMSASRERVVGGVSSGSMRLGDSVTWQARHFGLPFRMTSAITVHERPHRFVDEQTRGPFRAWWHEHSFTETETGGTRMVDVVEFRAPVGLLGALVDRLVLRRYLRSLLDQRNQWLKDALEVGRA